MSFCHINFWQWGDSVKSLPEVQVENIHCIFLIYQANNLVIEVYQVGQTSLHLPECVNYSSSPFCPSCSGNGFQNSVVCHLPRYWGEADRTVVSWAFEAYKKEYILLFFSPQEYLSVHGQSRVMECSLAITSPASLGTHSCISARPTDLYKTTWLEYFLIWTSSTKIMSF